MRTTIANEIYLEAKSNDKLMLLVGDLGFSVFDDFRRDFPKQFINMGIAEQNMIGVAAGLAMTGKKVIVYSIIPFITFRCLEQIRNDVCYHDLNIIILGNGVGTDYESAGFSHHGINDDKIMKLMPNMKVLTPANVVEAKTIIKNGFISKHPLYIRIKKQE